jgi:RND family efflux transporter MFP subunit
MPSRSIRVTLLAVLAGACCASARGGGADPASGDAPGPGGTILLRHCILEFDRAALLGSANTGVIQDVLVKPGDRVGAGQVLGRLLDADLRAELVLRIAEADNDTDVRLGELKLLQARSRLKASEVLSKRNMISAEELETHKFAAQSGELELEAARHRRNVARLASRQVEALIRSREFVSPHDGVVVAVLKSKGETVVANDPVFRVVGAERIRVTGSIDVGDAWQVLAGQVVRVTPEISGAELPVEREAFAGRVVYVDPEVSAEHQTCKVIAVVENRAGLLRAGLEARMEILTGNDDEPTRTRRSDP